MEDLAMSILSSSLFLLITGLFFKLDRDTPDAPKKWRQPTMEVVV